MRGHLFAQMDLSKIQIKWKTIDSKKEKLED